jgi:hypothetical protein
MTDVFIPVPKLPPEASVGDSQSSTTAVLLEARASLRTSGWEQTLSS